MTKSDRITSRLRALREAMKRDNIDIYVALSADPHLSEYLPNHWQTRQWLSGFTGSVGSVIITQSFAGLWVDSRYFEQADHELQQTGINVMHFVSPNTSYSSWLIDNAKSHQTIALDGAVTSLTLFEQLHDALTPQSVTIKTNWRVLDEIWSDRPSLPTNPIYEHDKQFEVASCNEKLTQLRSTIKQLGATTHLLSALDDIAWLTNLRGEDVSFNPVFLAHMLIDATSAKLFINPQKVSPALTQKLQKDGIEICDYNAIENALSQLSINSVLLLDPNKVTIKLVQSVPKNVTLIKHINPTTLSKSCKHDAEIAHIRHAMEEDGAALCEFFAWLDQAIERNETITELTIDEKITAARAKRELFVSQSFATIAAFNANGALPHYRATEERHAAITQNGLLLIDSGAQYHDGTTDITRMYAIGELNPQQIEDCTLVLKANIALSSLHFPNLIPAPLLDSVTRAVLWQQGLDYGHGTGHGVGYFLNVHEGPQVISYHSPILPQSKMKAGMITSIEPGLYRPGKWGIRIENLVANVPAQKTEFGEFLQFEILTLCPIDTRCINTNLLTEQERQWLNDYHQRVYTCLSPKVSGAALKWLEKRTQAI